MNMTPAMEKEFERVMQAQQAKEIIRFYNSLSERCFHGCVNEFTSRSLSSKEEICVYRYFEIAYTFTMLRCIDKFIRHSGRVQKVAQEAEQMMKQQQNIGDAFAAEQKR